MKFARIYEVNHDFFKFWNRDMAYILGFWWADGHITGDIFSISQKSSDDYILTAILKCMGSNYILYKRNGNSMFMIRSKVIVASIKSLGGIERKSKTISFPEVPSIFLCDFLRGLWDGDGCITKQTNRKSYSSSLTSGNLLFLKRVQSILIKNINGMKGGTIIKSTSKKGKKMPNGFLKNDSTWYSLSLSTNDTKRLGRFCYYDECHLCLKRKYDLFQSLTKIKDATYEKKYVSYDEAKIFVSNLDLKTWDDWKRFSSSGKRPQFIPSNPNRTYKKEFIGMNDFLGKKII